MSKVKASALTEDEIEEELLNNDLMCSGGVEDQTDLQRMDLEEKKNLLRSIKQSKENFGSEAGTSSRPLKKPIIIDTSSADFPSLATAAKANKLKLPRRQSSSSKPNSPDQCISLVDDDDEESIFTKSNKPSKFSLPFCVSDNAPPLTKPDRAYTIDKCPYYQMRGEYGIAFTRRILSDHESWKKKYNTEMRKSESQAQVENVQEFNDKESKSEENGDDENDPYAFTEVTKVYKGPGNKKKETNKSLDNVPSPSSRTPQRRVSRDSDCEEIQPVAKPDEQPKLGEWLTAARPKNKRNRKQVSNLERSQNQPEIQFDFDRSLWGGTGRRSGGPQSPAPARRTIPAPSVAEVEEEKVQCPICQREFTLSTVENHAATCEGFSTSPMDVEEGS